MATRGLDLAPGIPEAATRVFVPGLARTGEEADAGAVVVVNAGVEPVEAEVVVRTADQDTGWSRGDWCFALGSGMSWT
ncbi:MAG: hypothetical protein Ct9H300mP12_05180 [Acidimicrobiales bacterium]|nr:MAG: hypothetical protein Ct9H300mP12_05180 [Acidimicrobiales bacterium]